MLIRVNATHGARRYRFSIAGERPSNAGNLQRRFVMLNRRHLGRAGLIGVIFLTAAGCASSQDVSSVRSEVTTLQESVSAAQAAAERAAASADAAAQSAAQSAQSAAASADAAQAAAEKADRIFVTSQRK